MKNKRLIRKEEMKRNKLTRTLAVVFILIAVIAIVVNFGFAASKINPKILSQSPLEYNKISIEELKNPGIKLQKGDNLVQLPNYFFERKVDFKSLFSKDVLKNLDYVSFGYPSDTELNKEKTIYYIYSSQKKTSLKNSGKIETSDKVLYPIINIKMNKDTVWKINSKLFKDDDKTYYVYNFIKGNNFIVLPSSGFKDWFYLQFLGKSAENIYAVRDDKTKTRWNVPSDWRQRVATGRYIEYEQWYNQIENPVLWIYASADASIKQKIPEERKDGWNESEVSYGNWTLSVPPQNSVEVPLLKMLKNNLQIRKAEFNITLKYIGDRILNHYKKLTHNELDVLDGSIKIGNITFDYTEEISFENMNNSGIWVYEKNKDIEGDSEWEEVYHYIKFAGKNSGDHLFDYKLTFKEPLKAKASELKGSVIKILGRDYVISDVGVSEKNNNELSLTLMTWDEKEILREGDTGRLIPRSKWPKVIIDKVYADSFVEFIDVTYIAYNGSQIVNQIRVEELNELRFRLDDWDKNLPDSNFGFVGNINASDKKVELIKSPLFIKFVDDISDDSYNRGVIINILPDQKTSFIKIKGSVKGDDIIIDSIDYHTVIDSGQGFWSWEDSLSYYLYFDSYDSYEFTKGYLLGLDYETDLEYLPYNEILETTPLEDEVISIDVSLVLNSY